MEKCFGDMTPRRGNLSEAPEVESKAKKETSYKIGTVKAGCKKKEV